MFKRFAAKMIAEDMEPTRQTKIEDTPRAEQTGAPQAQAGRETQTVRDKYPHYEFFRH